MKDIGQTKEEEFEKIVQHTHEGRERGGGEKKSNK